MNAPLVVVIVLAAMIVLDLAALRFGCDSRSGRREMPGASDGRHEQPRRVRGRGVWPAPRQILFHSAPIFDAEWAAAPPLRGLLRLRPPSSAEGFARLDLAALGK